MKKTYNLDYEEGQYYIEYSMPENEEGKLIIDEKKMELDSVRFYKMFFEKLLLFFYLFFEFKRFNVVMYI